MKITGKKVGLGLGLVGATALGIGGVVHVIKGHNKKKNNEKAFFVLYNMYVDALNESYPYELSLSHVTKLEKDDWDGLYQQMVYLSESLSDPETYSDMVAFQFADLLSQFNRLKPSKLSSTKLCEMLDTVFDKRINAQQIEMKKSDDKQSTEEVSNEPVTTEEVSNEPVTTEEVSNEPVTTEEVSENESTIMSYEEFHKFVDTLIETILDEITHLVISEEYKNDRDVIDKIDKTIDDVFDKSVTDKVCKSYKLSVEMVANLRSFIHDVINETLDKLSEGELLDEINDSDENKTRVNEILKTNEASENTKSTSSTKKPRTVRKRSRVKISETKTEDATESEVTNNSMVDGE